MSSSARIIATGLIAFWGGLAGCVVDAEPGPEADDGWADEPPARDGDRAAVPTTWPDPTAPLDAALVCAADRLVCDDACVDPALDPAHCGGCGNACNSGLCYAGTCADALAGHVVVIGHSFATPSTPLEIALGNAVFLKNKLRMNVLVWVGSATEASVDGTTAALRRSARALGRRWSRTAISNSTQVAIKLPTADVFVIQPQPGYDDTYLGFLGDEWRLPLDDFVRRGGVIVVLDGGEPNGGTAHVLEPSGLLDLGARASVAGEVVTLAAPGDLLAASVPLQFAAPAGAVGYPPTSVTDVVTDGDGHAVVIHRATE